MKRPLDAVALGLIERIHETFRGVSRTGGVSWAQTEVRDNRLPSDDPIYHDRDRIWQPLVDDPEWDPSPGVGGFAFLDPIGFRYYLPAAMIRCIRAGYDVGIAFHLTWGEERWSLLDEAQRETVAEFVAYMSGLSLTWHGDYAEPEYESSWQAALTRYWKPF